MEVAFERCCGLDIHKDKIVACLKTQKANLSPGCQQVFNAPATRSLAPAQTEDWCGFQNDLDTGQQAWRGWCGSAAHKQ